MWPIAVYSPSPPAPIAPATTSPELIPIRAEKLRPWAAAQLGRVLGDVVEHLQRRVAGPPRVVLVGDRGAEDGHDPVAGELVDGALEALDRLGQDREEALHDLAPLLGVLLLGEVHRAADVGEQHRHLLALAVVLARSAGHASLASSVPCSRIAWRCVSIGSGHRRFDRHRPGHGAAARRAPAGGSSPGCAREDDAESLRAGRLGAT